jgi:hypothetical protein
MAEIFRAIRFDLFTPTYEPRCPTCDRQVGMAIKPVIVTGVVKRFPSEPDGLDYRQCAVCREFVRCEVVPPSIAKFVENNSGAMAA